MDLTTDKVRSLVRKWQTLIEAHVDVKTTDGYTLRMFCIGFTKKRANQVRTDILWLPTASYRPDRLCSLRLCTTVVLMTTELS